MLLPLTTVFADVPDPRMETANKLHRLVDILVIATCAVIGGADGWEEIAEYGRAKEDFFRRFLERPNGIPSHDTFARVFIKLAPDAFADRFGQWMRAACESTGLVHVAIDGKSARSSAKDTFTGCLHVVNAWAVENRLILGTRCVPEGGHEITTIPDLLAALDLAGAVVTMDAAGCQTEIVQQIRDQGGDYVVTVKGNQPTLHEAIRNAFEQAGENAFADCQRASSVEDGHGRHEERYVTVLKNPQGLPEAWADAGPTRAVGEVAWTCARCRAVLSLGPWFSRRPHARAGSPSEARCDVWQPSGSPLNRSVPISSPCPTPGIPRTASTCSSTSS
jgi:predicted transposase YbfD/YdcC